jgi:DNA-directed RNA polymerase sigma subunit (sigma70/sigma32)
MLALEESGLRPDQVQLIAERHGVTEQEVVDMNGRLGGDLSLNSPIREDSNSGGWQDWLVDEGASQEAQLAESEEADNRRMALGEALTVLNERERPSLRRGALPTSRSRSMNSPTSTACRASACARSRCTPLRRCRWP